MVHRIGVNSPENFAPKVTKDKKGKEKVETTVGVVNATGKKEPGFSTTSSAPGQSKEAAGQHAGKEFCDKYPSHSGKPVSTATAAEIRKAGFEVIHDPTTNLPNHATIIRPGGQWTPENSAKLASAFETVKVPQ